MNGNIVAACCIVNIVVALAAEAELEALFLDTKKETNPSGSRRNGIQVTPNISPLCR